MRKKALVTGITGQDGSYLVELLAAKGYEVHGIVRRVSLDNSIAAFARTGWMSMHNITFHECDMFNYARIFSVVEKVKPDECYHLAAQSFVGSEDEFTTMANINMTHNILSAIKEKAPNCKFYNAASSEMFGGMPGTAPQNENTPFHPRSPYAVSKVASFDLTRYYREQENGLFACNGILFNHESPRRGLKFVTRKITHAVAKIELGKQYSLALGNLSTKRDWGYAFEYVEAMWLMLQQDKPDDYVIATGETHTILEFVELAFQQIERDYNEFVTIDPTFYRPAEVCELRGDASKAKRILDWEPKIKFHELVEIMVKSDLELLKK